MKKSGILNPALCHLLASTGHTDLITVCDRGFPVPLQPERIDLALVDGIPTVLDVLTAIHKEFLIDRILVAEEMEAASPERLSALKEQFPKIRIVKIPHLELKEAAATARATVRTGDTTPYANIILVSG